MIARYVLGSLADRKGRAMQRTTMILLAWGLLTAPPASALAGPFAPVPRGSHKVDLDTAAGAFSIWSTDDLTGVNALRATFSMRQARIDKQWAPAFRFALTNGDEAVEFRGLGGKPKHPMVLMLTHRKGGQVVSEEAFMTFLMVDEVADLEIDWQPSGLVVVRLKSPQSLSISPTGETHEARMNAAPTGLQISASTGELEVSSLRLGVS